MFDNLIAPSLFDRLDSIARSLSRLADGVDRAFPPIDLERLASRPKRGPEAIIRYGRDDKGWAQEQLGSLIHEKGLPPDEERVELADAMNRWETSQEKED